MTISDSMTAFSLEVSARLDAITAWAVGGGIGEEQFSSFLRQEQASLIEKKGGIGLAEALFKSMAEVRNNG